MKGERHFLCLRRTNTHQKPGLLFGEIAIALCFIEKSTRWPLQNKRSRFLCFAFLSLLWKYNPFPANRDHFSYTRAVYKCPICFFICRFFNCRSLLKKTSRPMAITWAVNFLLPGPLSPPVTFSSQGDCLLLLLHLFSGSNDLFLIKHMLVALRM